MPIDKNRVLFFIFILSLLFLFFPIPLTLAQEPNPGPAGIPQLESMFARVVCVSVPLGYTTLLVVLVITGIKYLVSGGELKAISAAHQSATWGILGIIILAIAWLILQLVQNFTGVKVTQFTLSSLPGVQGFTGSCWGPPPEAPNPTPLPQPNQSQNPQNPPLPPPKPITVSSVIPQQLSTKPQPTVYQPPKSKTFENCNDFFTPVDLTKGSLAGSVVYINKTDDIIELAKVLDQPRFIVLLVGSVDSTVFSMTATAKERYGLNNLPFITPGTPAYVARYEKSGAGVNALLNAYREATDIVTQILLKHGQTPSIIQPDIIFHCPDYDYYGIIVNSPIIYLYPPKILSIQVQVSSPITTNLTMKQGHWNVIGQPNGTLTTLDGKKYPYIPYEFLRNDFKRPDKGFVISGDKLEQFLKNNLWRKLGLKDNEIEDYWVDTKPRVKPSPYYFVSLIDRSEIDRVLPMEVNPKPDTIIRNMTYILPLSSPFSPQPLEGEKLIAPQRKGFTVLENGVFTDGF